jgi:hypothetical protein
MRHPAEERVSVMLESRSLSERLAMRRCTSMQQTDITVGRGRLTGVLIANAILWGAALVVAGDWRLGGPAVIALISIGSLFAVKTSAA